VPAPTSYRRSRHPLRTIPFLAALQDVIPHTLLQEVVAQHAPATRRDRALSYELTLALVIAMSLMATDSIGAVLSGLLFHLRPFCPRLRGVTNSAITQARQRLGVRPVAALFHRVCVPLATPATRGAFYAGLRLMAIDSETIEVPDTPANVRAFGRHRGPGGAAAFPQVLATYLGECGTHALIDVVWGLVHRSAPAAATRLLRRVTSAMLLLLDAGLCERPLVQHLLRRNLPFLERIGTDLLFPPVKGLPDGSYLAVFSPVAPSRTRPSTPAVLVRVIVYTLTDPARPGWQETHRLLTSLLDPVAHPARALVCLYHERWEIELTIDELATHLWLPRSRRAARPRSW
jgi:hypothetical protein